MSDSLRCGFCSQNFEFLTIPQRQDHYEAHFLTSGPSTDAETSRPNKKDKRFHPISREPWKMLAKKIQNDVFWYPSLGTPPPSNFTPGLIPIIKHSLETLCAKGKLTRAVLCHERVVHISKEFWDAGWGCGYRNFLILCTGLLEQRAQPLYFPLLDSSPPPSIRGLQLWIQRAWEDGYDQIGRAELRNKIVGTNKWIGTAEIYIGLSHRGIPAELLDFDGFQDKRDCAAAVIRWMVEYFTPRTSEPDATPSTSINDVLGRTAPILVTQLMPVILQHKGHSRVIVGYQRHADGTVSLLTFDTGRLLPRAFRTSAQPPYDSIDQKGTSEGCSEAHLPIEKQTTTRQPNDPDKPISLADPLTPPEPELGKSHIASAGHSGGDSKKFKLKSTNRFRSGRSDSSSASKTFRQTEPDVNQAQKVFRLTSQQLSSHAEYQVLYVPLNPPLTEGERLNRRGVVKCERITAESPSLRTS